MEVSLENLKSFLLRNLVLVKPLVLFGDCSNDMAACTIELGIFPFPIDCAILDCVLRVFDLAQGFLVELDNDLSQVYCACRCDLLLLYRFSCHVDILRSPQMSVTIYFEAECHLAFLFVSAVMKLRNKTRFCLYLPTIGKTI